jgi:hypothetical protein
VGTITSCIRHLRGNIEKRLLKHESVVCGPEEVIDHDQQGYFLRDWIAVHDRRANVPAGTSASTNIPAGTPTNVPAGTFCASPTPNVPAGTPSNVPAGTLAADADVAGTLEDVPAGTPWNERQSWVLHELSRIGKLTRQQIENAFHVGEKTVKREGQFAGDEHPVLFELFEDLNNNSAHQ